MRYGMVIDLAKCTACQACTIACKSENNVPDGIFWHRVIPFTKGRYPSVRTELTPRPCMHCENAPCVTVCPTKATYKRKDGLVLIDYDKCIGCKYCIQACPYGVRSYTVKQPAAAQYNNPEVKAVYKGVVEKCTFCVHRIDKAVKEGKKVGNPDGEVTTACNEACPSEARYFGDLDDPNSVVSKKIAQREHVILKEYLGTKSQVYYLK